MKAKNKKTGKICDIFWDMGDFGRRCYSSEYPGSLLCYNADALDYLVGYEGGFIPFENYCKLTGREWVLNKVK